MVSHRLHGFNDYFFTCICRHYLYRQVRLELMKLTYRFDHRLCLKFDIVRTKIARSCTDLFIYNASITIGNSNNCLYNSKTVFL